MHHFFSEDNSLSIGLYRNSVLLWRLVAIALAKEVRPPVNKAKVLGWVSRNFCSLDKSYLLKVRFAAKSVPIKVLLGRRICQVHWAW
jgi:hypothetical protein